MRKGRTILTVILFLCATQAGRSIETGRVDIGVGGAYDGTVWITRGTGGSLVFRDQQVGSSVTLQQLKDGINDHGSLSGLGDDDHTQYHNSVRHLQTHSQSFNDDLVISPDVGNNITLGAHTADSFIHVMKNAAETIAGTWRFTGQPVFEGSLLMEAVAPGNNATIDFGTGASPPCLRYVGNWDEFELSRPVRSTSGSLTTLLTNSLRVYTNVDGRNLAGQPAATLTDFVSVNGIASGNLLDRSVNEDIAGQWDFLDRVRVFGDLEFHDGVATGVVTAAGITLTTASESAEQSGTFSYLETTSDILKVILDGNDNQSGYKRIQIFGGDRAKFAAWEFAHDGDVGIARFRRDNDGFAFLQIDVGSNGPSFTYGPYNGFFARSSGDVWVRLNSTDGSDYLRIQDSQNVEQWRCSSDGDVAMTANARQTIPDGADGPFIYSFSAGTNYYPDAGETLTPTTRTLKGLEYQGSGTSYVGFPIPNDVLGANVVLDRITIYCVQEGGAGVVISSIALVDDSDSAVRTYGTTITDTTQWLSSDYTMNDSKSYVIRMTLSQGSGGSLRVIRFKVEYHLE